MSFWSNSPGPGLWDAAKAAFGAPVVPRRIYSTGPIPSGKFRYERATEFDVDALLDFWHKNFRRHGGARIAYLPSDIQQLLHYESRAIILIVRSRHNSIIGTILAKPLGHWWRTCLPPVAHDTFETTYIDMFCVKNKYRGTGVGTTLLLGIREELQREGREAAVFLKEGAPLTRLMPSLKTSFFTFRRVSPDEEDRYARVELWTQPHFTSWIGSLPRNSQKTPYLVNSGSQRTSTQSRIYAYHGAQGQCVIIISRANQFHPNDLQPIIWMTGYIENGTITEGEKRDAMRKISAVASYHFGAPWVWMDGKHAPPDELWMRDGPYHFYAFSWNPGVFFNGEPVLIF